MILINDHTEYGIEMKQSQIRHASSIEEPCGRKLKLCLRCKSEETNVRKCKTEPIITLDDQSYRRSTKYCCMIGCLSAVPLSRCITYFKFASRDGQTELRKMKCAKNGAQV